MLCTIYPQQTSDNTNQHYYTHMIHSHLLRGDHHTVQKGRVSATAWKDNKVVRVISTTCDPNHLATVHRRQRDGTKQPVSCPQAVRDYNELMRAIDHGDQLRGYYRCRTKFRKFYMYIYSFLKDVAITNSFILSKFASTTNLKRETLLEFRTKLAVELIGDYCSRKLPGCRRSQPRILPLTHFPLKHHEGKRGRCKLCKASNKRSDTTWYCQTCQEWFCHSGKADSDCFFIVAQENIATFL